MLPFIDKSKEDVKVKLFDMSGKLVLSDTRENTSKKAFSTRYQVQNSFAY